MNTIQSQWEQYYTRTMKPSGIKPGSVQYEETKRAFYAGAGSYFAILMEVTNNLSEDAAAGVLKGVSEELKTFFDNVLKGKV